MVRAVLLALVASVAKAAAWGTFRNDRAFLGAEMQPEVVAKTLSHVEDEWKAQARAFIKCELSESNEAQIRDCDNTPSSFLKSCATVVSAVVKGSSGNPKVLVEYMGDVCRQKTMASWHQTSCAALADTINMKLTASHYDNRINFQARPVCDEFWAQFLVEQKKVHEQELAAIKKQEEIAAVAAAKEAKEAKAQAEKVQKEHEEAEKVAAKDAAKEQAELEAERKIVTLRASQRINRTQEDLHEEAEVDAVEAAANKKIEEANEVEKEATAVEAEGVASAAVAKSSKKEGESAAQKGLAQKEDAKNLAKPLPSANSKKPLPVAKAKVATHSKPAHAAIAAKVQAKPVTKAGPAPKTAVAKQSPLAAKPVAKTMTAVAKPAPKKAVSTKAGTAPKTAVAKQDLHAMKPAVKQMTAAAKTAPKKA